MEVVLVMVVVIAMSVMLVWSSGGSSVGKNEKSLNVNRVCI